MSSQVMSYHVSRPNGHIMANRYAKAEFYFDGEFLARQFSGQAGRYLASASVV